MKRTGLLLLMILPLVSSCLSLTGELTVNSSRSYLLTLDYSVNRDYASLKYLATNRSVVLLPLTAEEWAAFVRSYGGVTFQANQFSRRETGDRLIIRTQLLMENLDMLRDLFRCRAELSGDIPDALTLTFDRGGQPSEEAVTFINGYCAGEQVDFTINGPGGVASAGSWSLRELLLETDPPSLSLEWRE